MNALCVKRWCGVLAIAAVSITAACSDSATGPTAANNAQIITRFQVLAAQSGVLHSDQLLAAVHLLQHGAPVGRGQISIGGKTSTYSTIAEYDISDTDRVPVDSFLTFFAWSGADADTMVEVDAGADNAAILVTDRDSIHLDQTVDPIVVTTSQPGRHCSLPAGISPTPNVDCQVENITMPVTAQLNDQPLPFVDFAIPDEQIAAIRQESQNPRP